jgi:hypothetical protein
MAGPGPDLVSIGFLGFQRLKRSETPKLALRQEYPHIGIYGLGIKEIRKGIGIPSDWISDRRVGFTGAYRGRKR